jgi:solute carrier family 13 (sodium-dependent dicarboxylate transporter), member 2/3/5
MTSENGFSFEEWRKRLGLPIAVAAGIAVFLIQTPAELSVEGHKSLALFAAVFVLYLTESIPLAITSLAIVPLAVLMGIVTPSVALQGFASTSVYLILGAFVLAAAMVKSKLAERITYLIMLWVGTSAIRITLGITLANIVLAFLVPSTTARTAVLLPVCIAIIEVFGKEGRTKFAVNLLLTLAFTNATIGSGILTATVPNPVTIDFIAKVSKHAITYGEWFVYGFPPALFMTMLTWWVIQKVFPPEIKNIPGGDSHVKEKLQELGSISRDEVKSLIVFILVVGLWVTGGWTKIDTTIACLAGIIILFLPKLGFLTWKDAEKGISWQIILVCGGGVSLGEILMKTGAAKWLAMIIFKALGLSGLSVIVMLILIMLIIQYMHILFVGTTAMATAILPIVLGMAQAADINPAVFALPAGMIIGGYPLLMFYNTLPNILIYGTGKLKVGDFPKVGFILCTVACIVYAICASTYWKWLGLY